MAQSDVTKVLEQANICFKRVWEMTSEATEVKAYGPGDEDLQQSRRARIAKYVAATAEVCDNSPQKVHLGERTPKLNSAIFLITPGTVKWNRQSTLCGKYKPEDVTNLLKECILLYSHKSTRPLI